MWPPFLYLSKEESIKCLRQLELEAYSLLLSAFRAQGPLTQEKRKVLRETSRILNITIDRHKTEVRRAVNDEKLNTIAYNIHGPGISSEDWCQEGRRVLPMFQRISPQTLHPIMTDSFSGSSTLQQNYQDVELPSFEHKKISGPDGSELLPKNNSENIDDLENFNQEKKVEESTENNPTSTKLENTLKHRPLITKSSFYRQSFGNSTQEPDKTPKTYSNKKIINKNQKLMIVSSTQTIPTTSILHKTLSVPMTKVTKLNLDKFKIVSSSSIPSINVSNLVSSENAITLKNKLITSKGGKKVIPLSQLQLLNHKLSAKGGIKVLPLSSKLLGKNITMTRITPGQGLTTIPFNLPASKNEMATATDYKNNDEKNNDCNKINDITCNKVESPIKKINSSKLLNSNVSFEIIPKVKIEKTENAHCKTERTEHENAMTSKTKYNDLRPEESEVKNTRSTKTENEDLLIKNEDLLIKNEDLLIKNENTDDFKKYEGNNSGINKTERANFKDIEMEKNKHTDCKSNDKGSLNFTTKKAIVNDEMTREKPDSSKFKTESTSSKNDNIDKIQENDDGLAALLEIDSSEFIEPELKEPLIVKKEL